MTVQGRQQAYAAGNKTYGFGRSNPTSGPVDPLGYRERNLMLSTIGRRLGTPPAAPHMNAVQQAQHDAAARGQTIGPAPQPSTTMAPSPTGTMHPVAPAIDTRAPAPNPITVGQGMNEAGAMPSGMAGPGDTGGGPMPSGPPGGGVGSWLNGPVGLQGHGGPSAPQGYIDPAGPPGMQGGGIPQMQPPVQQPAQPPLVVEHRFMPGYDQSQHDINSHEYDQERQINEAAPQAYQHLTDVYAGRGMSHSGRYAGDYGAAQNQTASQITALQQAKAQQLAALNAQNTDWNQTQDNAAAQKFQQSLQDQIGQAGSLGLDTTTQNPQAPDYASLLQQLMSQYGQTPAGVSGSPFSPSMAAPTPAPKLPAATPGNKPIVRAPSAPAKSVPVRPVAKTPVPTRKPTAPTKAPVRKPAPSRKR